MNASITFAMAMSCAIPACIGIYKCRKTDSRYHPFIYMMIIDVLMELIYYFTTRYSQLARFNQLAVNIYMLLNFGLFLYLVHTNGYINRFTMQLLFVLALLTGLLNFIYYDTVYHAFFYLLCFVSAVMLFISINILSRQVIELKVKLSNNFWFWVSSFSVLYNAFNLLIFGLYIFAMFETPNGKAIGIIQHFVNATCYLVFAVAIYRIPEKRKNGFKAAIANRDKAGTHV